MSDLRVGVVGAGLMGADHIVRIQKRTAGATVSAIIDPDALRAEAAAQTAQGSDTFSSLTAAIEANSMDAVLIATPGQFHLSDLLAALEAKLPVLCEKPMTPDPESAIKVIDAEVAGGTKLIQVGFMRRFDPGYMELRDIVVQQPYGDLLALRCQHRNPSVTDGYTNEMLINDSVVHEFDVVRYLTDSPIAAVEIKFLKRNTNNFGDLHEPILAFLETESGVVADVEMNVSVKFGYQVKTEAVFENGVVEIGRTAGTTVWSEGRYSGKEHMTFKTRFKDAFENELQRWVNAAKGGTIDGPSAWDGYLVAEACKAGVEAMQSRQRVEVSYLSKPDFYK